MIGFLSELLAVAHVPIAMLIIWRCIIALRVCTEKDARFALECVLTVGVVLIALRLSDYAIPLEGDARYLSWRTVVSLIMLSFLPLINAQARSARQRDE